MSHIELIEKIVDLAEVAERSPAFEAELVALLGRAPMNAVKTVAGAADKLEAMLPAALGGSLRAGAANGAADGANVAGTVSSVARFSKGIPDLSNGFLPPGIHAAQWTDVVEKYGSDPNRAVLLQAIANQSRYRSAQIRFEFAGTARHNFACLFCLRWLV